MVETITAHYGWTKPEITHSASTWGGFLNNDLDAIDALVFANQQGIVPIGAIQMFAGATAPTNWLICDGSSLSTAAPNDKLFAVIGYAFGGGGLNFNLPDLRTKFPIGAGPSNALATTGGASTVTLDATMIPAHSHPIQPAAAHTHTATATEAAHTHSLTDHLHTVNAVFGGGAEIQGGSGWGQHNIPSGPMTAGANVGSTAAAVSVSVSPASVTIPTTTDNTGGGLSHSNMPPFVALSFIIRFS